MSCRQYDAFDGSFASVWALVVLFRSFPDLWKNCKRLRSTIADAPRSLTCLVFLARPAGRARCLVIELARVQWRIRHFRGAAVSEANMMVTACLKKSIEAVERVMLDAGPIRVGRPFESENEYG